MQLLYIQEEMMHKSSPKERAGPHANKFSGEVHTDMWGPSLVKSLGGKTYYISFTDDKTRYTKLSLLTHNSRAFEAYLSFEAWASTQPNYIILILWSDQGGEYLSDACSKHLARQGTEQRLTVHDSPHENRVAK